MCCIALALLVVLAETGCTLVDNTVPGNRLWSIICNVTGFGVSPFVFLVESNFYHLGQKRKDYWVYFPALVHFGIVCVSPFAGWIFYVDEQCRYGRGPLFTLYIAVFAFSVLVSMVRKIKAIQNYPHYFRSRILSSTLILLVGLSIQVIYPMYSVSWMIISVYLVLYYAFSCEAGGMVDGLTGLLNRAAFNNMMRNFKMQKNRTYSLAMLDVNDFKSINDTQGHAYGDFCLKEISETMKEVFKNRAYVFRFGGDEFCVLIREKHNRDVESYLEEITRRINEKRELYHPFPELAMGYAVIEAGKELRETIGQADLKMYQNKRAMKKRAGTSEANMRK